MANTAGGSWLRGLRGAIVASAVGTAAVVSHAFQVKKQFYPAVVYVVNSNVSMMVSPFSRVPLCTANMYRASRFVHL